MFTLKKSYKRLELNQKFGGNRQRGISVSATYPYIFIFSKHNDKQDVYEDKWNDGYFHYSGEGRIGDQKFTGGNKSIKDHIINNKRVFLFEKDLLKSGFWIFVGEVELKGTYLYKNKDDIGNIRDCIRFQFKLIDNISRVSDKPNDIDSKNEFIQNDSINSVEINNVVKEPKKIISSSMPVQNENPRITFEANDSNLGNSFFGRHSEFVIPRYQRPYSWTKDQVNDFWNDLIDNQSNYFIGSVIFNTRNASNDKIEVIDGQQRLLTSTIFCRALLDITREIDNSRAELIQLQDFAWENPTTFERVFKLTPGETTFSFFRDYIQIGKRVHSGEIETTLSNNIREISLHSNREITVEEKLIYSNYHIFKQKISEYLSSFSSSSEKIQKIGELRGKLRNLGIVEIRVQSDEAAYEIFETTNARGLDLSVTDLLKNYIFRNVNNEDGSSDSAILKWNEILDNIDKSKEQMSRFIRYFWLSRYDFVEMKKLFRAIKENTSDWGKLLEDLEEDSKIYKLISIDNQTYLEEYIIAQGNEGAIRHVGRIISSIVSIKKMNITQHKVYVISILRNLKNLEYDPTLIFETLEKFSFMFNKVCSLRSVAVEKLFSKFAIDLQNKSLPSIPLSRRRSDVQSSFSAFINKLLELKPDEENFKGSFRSLKYNDGGDNFLMSYILQKIDSHLMNSNELSHNIRELSIEHILPQNPVHWGLTSEQVENYVHNIGNLTLLDRRINGRANNYRLIQQDENGTEVGKLLTYESSELNITIKLVERIRNNDNNWNEESIVERTNYFADLAFDEIWNF